jgi:hypothetical protein
MMGVVETAVIGVPEFSRSTGFERSGTLLDACESLQTT